jgi:hypothetical protein
MKTLLITFFLLLPQLAVQAEERPAQPESFATFWAGFKSAVAKNDKEAVVAATKFPFYGQLSKADFIKQYSSLFPKEVQKCFATAKPVKDRDSYFVFCNQEIFTFGKVNGTYKFTGIDMND